MAGHITNRGRLRILETVYDGRTPPSNFWLALCTNATPPSRTTNTFGELTQIAAGNGYAANGMSVSRNDTDFPAADQTEDDTNNWAQVAVRDIGWSASGGQIPISGGAARWAVLLDSNATPASREVIVYWDLGSDRIVSTGQPLTLQDSTIRLAFQAGLTNRGALRELQWYFAGRTLPANYNFALTTNGTPPTDDTNTFSQVSEIATGNGYTGAVSVAKGTGFDTPTEDDTAHFGEVQLVDQVFTASGGPLPSDSVGARWATLLDDNATPANREVIRYWDLVNDRVVSDGNPMTVSNAALRIA